MATAVLNSFMTKNAFIIFLLAILAGNVCDAQSTPANTNWGQSIQGIRISIGTITNIFSPASIIVVNAQIQNTSTNMVFVHETASWKDFSVWLEDASGKKSILTDNSRAIIEDRNFIKKIRPGEICSWKIRLFLSKETAFGDYTMKATRKITMNGRQFVIESNPLLIQVE